MELTRSERVRRALTYQEVDRFRPVNSHRSHGQVMAQTSGWT